MLYLGVRDLSGFFSDLPFLWSKIKFIGYKKNRGSENHPETPACPGLALVEDQGAKLCKSNVFKAPGMDVFSANTILLRFWDVINLSSSLNICLLGS